ncbi:outer membrane protein assembly factor BamB family protein [Arthrobacter cupressi]
MKTTQAATAGAVRRYRNVYQGVPNVTASFFRTPEGVLKIAGASSGLDNQLQVLDAATGVRETSANPFPRNAAGVGKIAVDVKDGTLLAYGADPLVQRVTPGGTVSTAYTTDPEAKHSSFAVAADSRGRIWNGNYPTGNATRFDPATGKIMRTARLQPEAQYVRALAIDASDNVYAGTGARFPSIFTWHTDTPGRIEEIKLPASRTTGFVRRIEAHDGLLFVYVTEEDGKLTFGVYGLESRQWLKPPWDWIPSAMISSSLEKTGDIYAVAVSGKSYKLMHIDAKTLKASFICSVPGATRAMDIDPAAKGKVANLVCETESGYRYLRISLERKAIIKQVPAGFTRRTIKLQTLLPGSGDGRIYFGGYLGEGIGSLDLSTGNTRITGSDAGVKQIEGMTEFDPRTIYVGSYTGGVLFRFNPVSGSIKELINLREKHGQSRPVCWAVAGGRVVAGTVPEYGKNGGALVFLNPRRDSDIKVMKEPVPGQSVLGLVGEGRIIYGTTGIKGGYGAKDDLKPAHVFAWDVGRSKLLWKHALVGEGEINSPILVDGRLLVSTSNGVVSIDKRTGSPEASYRLFDRLAPARYKTSTIRPLKRSGSIAHLSGGTVTLLDLQRGKRGEVLRGAYTDMIVDGSGRLVLVENGTNIVDLEVALSA